MLAHSAVLLPLLILTRHPHSHATQSEPPLLWMWLRPVSAATRGMEKNTFRGRQAAHRAAARTQDGEVIPAPPLMKPNTD